MPWALDRHGGRRIRGRQCCFSVPGPRSSRQGLLAGYAAHLTVPVRTNGPYRTERRGAATGSAGGRPERSVLELLQGDLGALGLELGLGLLRGLLVDLLQDGLRRGLDRVLGFLEAQAGQLAHDLDDLDLLAAVGLEDDVELVLLLLLRRLGGRT